MTRGEILALVRRVLEAEFELEGASIREDTRLVDDLDLDSVDAVALAVRLEEETDLTLEEAELRALRTVGDVVGVLHGRLAR